MKIGLMGFEFTSANKGCEALVYSFISIIQDILTEGDIIYNFSGLDIGSVSDYFSSLHFVNVPPKIKDIKFNYLRSLKKCDIIFDVTMGDSFSDLYSIEYYNCLIKHKRIGQILCKKYILLPQTYGPFQNKSLKKAYKVLKKASKIYCRDEMSQKFLEEKFDIKNSELVSDMAFVLPYNSEMYLFSEKKKIGINISGLLYKGGFLSKNQFDLSLNYPQFIEKLIDELSVNYEVHLIPHVIDLKEDAYDDDYKVCKMLNKIYPNTILAPAFNTPIEAKSYISNMDVFIGSRMHSTIAAFSAGVVTIPVSYSRKFDGLFNSLNYEYIVDGRKETTDSALRKIMHYLKDSNTLAAAQKNSLALINKKNKQFLCSIEALLKK